MLRDLLGKTHRPHESGARFWVLEGASHRQTVPKGILRAGHLHGFDSRTRCHGSSYYLGSYDETEKQENVILTFSYRSLPLSSARSKIVQSVF